MKPVSRYLVTWGNELFMEPFELWRDAQLWHTTVCQESDPEAKILYWNQRLGEYKEASMPSPHIAVLPQYAEIMRRCT